MLNTLRLNRGVAALSIILAALFVAPAAFAQGTGSVKGKVRSVKGAGIAGASVTARQNGLDKKSVTANSKGEFLLEGLESGRYNLVFEAPGFSSGVLYNVEIEKNKVTDLTGRRLILTADQGTQVIVKGSVFTKEGVSIPGAEIRIERVSSDGSVRRVASAYTSESGEFTFRQSPGTAKLRVIVSFRGLTATKEVEVDEPAIYRLAISLDVPQP